MKQLYTICYVSKASTALTNSQVEDLFEYTATWNNKHDVSGILLHSIGNFFQVLEGTEKVLISLFRRIKEDSRHGELYEIFNKSTSQPVFENYKSTFDIVKTNNDLKMLLTYLNQDNSNSTNLKLKRLLKPFDMLGDF
jgi:hypothetical protein